MKEFNLREIEKIEVENIVKNPDWFYHGFDFGNIAEILKKGILAKKYLDYPESDFGLNGKHYISLSKDTNQSDTQSDTTFIRYKEIGPLLILDNLKAVKCKNKFFCCIYSFTFSLFTLGR